jgi:hypothetical protein
MGKEDGKFPSHPQKEKSMAQRKIHALPYGSKKNIR